MRTFFLLLVLLLAGFFSSAQTLEFEQKYGHSNYLRGMDATRDGKYLVTGSKDRTAIVWDAANGQLIYKLIGHTNWLSSTFFSPDSKHILTAGDSSARVWDVSTGKLEFMLAGHTGWVYRASYSPDGELICTVSEDSTARVWNSHSGKLLLNFEGHKAKVWWAAFSPNGAIIASSSENNVILLWNSKTGALLTGGKSGAIYGRYPSFTNDGSRMIAGSVNDSSINVYDAYNGSLLLGINVEEKFNWRQLSQDSKYLSVSLKSGKVRIYDLADGHLLTETGNHSGDVWSAEFSGNGNYIVTASGDKTFEVIESHTGKVLLSYNVGFPVWYAFFSKDNKHVYLYGENYYVRLVNWQENKFVLDFEIKNNPVVKSSYFSCGGKYLLFNTSNGTFVLDVGKGKIISELQNYVSGIKEVSFSKDNKYVSIAYSDKSAKIWELETGKLILDLKEHTDDVTYAAISSENKLIVTTSEDKTAKIWDMKTGALLTNLNAHDDVVNWADFSPDRKKVVTCSDDYTAKVWDVKAGNVLFNFEGHTGKVLSAYFSSNNKWVITASDDSSAKVWNAKTGEVLLSLKEDEKVWKALFSPDGKCNILFLYDGSVKIYDQKGLLLKTINLKQDEIEDYVYGCGLFVVNDDGIKIFDEQTGLMLYNFTLGFMQGEFLVKDRLGHFDGSEYARKLTDIKCGSHKLTEEEKSLLRVPRLAEKVMNGEKIEPGIESLKICD